MENVKISKICGLCAGCKNATNTAINSKALHKKVGLFKEIVHNKSVNERLEKQGIMIKNSLSDFEKDELVILRAHGEPKTTYDMLNKLGLKFVDCTCPKVKKIHELVEKFSKDGYKIIIIGKHGNEINNMHPEIVGTAGWCEEKPILIENEDDLYKLFEYKNEKFYLICQTTFNINKAEKLAELIKEICDKRNCELSINFSICSAQRLINEASYELAKDSDIMLVVGSKHSSNTTELFNNLSKTINTIFLEDISLWKESLKKANFVITKNSRIGITAGASTDPEELLTLKNEIKNYILENTMNYEVINHNSVRIDDIYFDPYGLKEQPLKAKYIFITHPHYDHLCTEDIDKIVTDETIFIATKDCNEILEKHYEINKKIYVLPNEKLHFADFDIETIPAYNKNKDFHKKEFNWVGYKLFKDGICYLIVGDSDMTEELLSEKTDVLFVPIGGTYTMNADEASLLTNKICPKVAVPTHYNCLVGSKEDEAKFLSKVNGNIKTICYL